jgi:cardiolipin synthase
MAGNPRPSESLDLANQAFSRTAGAELITGNRVRLLRDGAENYQAWMRSIQAARKWIHFEMYILYEDAVGRQFAEALEKKASEGVKVRVLYDWFGTIGRTSRRFWRRLRSSGIEVRSFNPPALDSPLAWVSRDHRKMLSVDGRIAYVTGLCVGEDWIGHPDRNIEPWRDTGVEIEGPAVRDVDRAFADTWNSAGEPLDSKDISAFPREAGDVSIRVVAAVPSAGGVYRLDHLITALAQRTIWLSDAYFAGTASYVHALRSAAQSGVDVRLLIPSASDIPVIRSISRAGLRPLLESGVRVFEWNGSMMHAKTAVVDGSWARVGSTNLNLASWFGNWELDVVIESATIAREMEAMYLDDLSKSTELVLHRGWRKPPAQRRSDRRGGPRPMAGGTSRTAAGMMRIGRSVGAAITRRRELGPAEAVIMFWGSLILTLVSVVLVKWPKALAYPLAVFCAWLALSLILQAIKLLRRRRAELRRTHTGRDSTT